MSEQKELESEIRYLQRFITLKEAELAELRNDLARLEEKLAALQPEEGTEGKEKESI